MALSVDYAASVPEPAPKDEGTEVTPQLVEWLAWHGFDLSIPLVKERDAFGRAKYGQPLKTGDGRSTFEDLRQEIGDALQYAMKARLQGIDITPLLSDVRALELLIKGE